MVSKDSEDNGNEITCQNARQRREKMQMIFSFTEIANKAKEMTWTKDSKESGRYFEMTFYS